MIDIGSLPTPPPPLLTAPPSVTIKVLAWIGTYAPFFVVGMAFVSMAISALYRYHAGFREWWERHICAWMEENALPQGKEKV